VLFNTHCVKGQVLPFVVITEGPLDALLLESLPYPGIGNVRAVAQFDGNSETSWLPEWNQFIRGAVTVYIVADRDEEGTKIALGKQHKIPGSVIITPREPWKDAGEIWQGGGDLAELIPSLATAKIEYRQQRSPAAAEHRRTIDVTQLQEVGVI
jgi:hypothetical protein